VREQSQQDGLARSIGTDDGRVLTDADRQREAIENAAIVFDDAGIDQLEDRIRRHAAIRNYELQIRNWRWSGTTNSQFLIPNS
jgi:hypothetical protein